MRNDLAGSTIDLLPNRGAIRAVKGVKASPRLTNVASSPKNALNDFGQMGEASTPLDCVPQTVKI